MLQTFHGFANPRCAAKRISVAETNDALWGALDGLLIQPERIHSLIAPEPGSEPQALKKELAAIERDEKSANALPEFR